MKAERDLHHSQAQRFDDPNLDLEAQPVSYDGESAAAKADRRRANWTPARLA